MQIKLFTISSIDEGISLTEMNKFIATNKVLEVEQQFYKNEKGAWWSFCVRYISNTTTDNTFGSSKTKVDYKAVLSETQFTVFSQLREKRKEIANNDAVPAYAVFTDEELGIMAKLPVINLSEMQKIKGIGEKKMEKYGKQLIEMFT